MPATQHKPQAVRGLYFLLSQSGKTEYVHDIKIQDDLYIDVVLCSLADYKKFREKYSQGSFYGISFSLDKVAEKLVEEGLKSAEIQFSSDLESGFDDGIEALCDFDVNAAHFVVYEQAEVTLDVSQCLFKTPLKLLPMVAIETDSPVAQSLWNISKTALSLGSVDHQKIQLSLTQANAQGQFTSISSSQAYPSSTQPQLKTIDSAHQGKRVASAAQKTEKKAEDKQEPTVERESVYDILKRRINITPFSVIDAEKLNEVSLDEADSSQEQEAACASGEGFSSANASGGGLGGGASAPLELIALLGAKGLVFVGEKANWRSIRALLDLFKADFHGEIHKDVVSKDKAVLKHLFGNRRIEMGKKPYHVKLHNFVLDRVIEKVGEGFIRLDTLEIFNLDLTQKVNRNLVEKKLYEVAKREGVLIKKLVIDSEGINEIKYYPARYIEKGRHIVSDLIERSSEKNIRFIPREILEQKLLIMQGKGYWLLSNSYLATYGESFDTVEFSKSISKTVEEIYGQKPRSIQLAHLKIEEGELIHRDLPLRPQPGFGEGAIYGKYNNDAVRHIQTVLKEYEKNPEKTYTRAEIRELVNASKLGYGDASKTLIDRRVFISNGLTNGKHELLFHCNPEVLKQSQVVTEKATVSFYNNRCSGDRDVIKNMIMQQAKKENLLVKKIGFLNDKVFSVELYPAHYVKRSNHLILFTEPKETIPGNILEQAGKHAAKGRWLTANLLRDVANHTGKIDYSELSVTHIVRSVVDQYGAPNQPLGRAEISRAAHAVASKVADGAGHWIHLGLKYVFLPVAVVASVSSVAFAATNEEKSANLKEAMFTWGGMLAGAVSGKAAAIALYGPRIVSMVFAGMAAAEALPVLALCFLASVAGPEVLRVIDGLLTKITRPSAVDHMTSEAERLEKEERETAAAKLCKDLERKYDEAVQSNKIGASLQAAEFEEKKTDIRALCLKILNEDGDAETVLRFVARGEMKLLSPDVRKQFNELLIASTVMTQAHADLGAKLVFDQLGKLITDVEALKQASIDEVTQRFVEDYQPTLVERLVKGLTTPRLQLEEQKVDEPIIASVGEMLRKSSHVVEAHAQEEVRQEERKQKENPVRVALYEAAAKEKPAPSSFQSQVKGMAEAASQKAAQADLGAHLAAQTIFQRAVVVDQPVPSAVPSRSVLRSALQEAAKNELTTNLLAEKTRDAIINPGVAATRPPVVPPAFTPIPRAPAWSGNGDTIDFGHRTSLSLFLYRNSAGGAGSHLGGNGVSDIVRHAVYNCTSIYGAYKDVCSRVPGFSVACSESDFNSIVRSNGLESSYLRSRSELEYSFLRNRLWREYGVDIGGVASQVGVIKDMIDSKEQVVSLSDWTLCFPTQKGQLPFIQGELQQILREIASAQFVDKTHLFFSLHFESKNHSLYPVIHPALKNTLIGKVAGLLDIFMKAYCNGAAYSAEFIEEWCQTMNCDESYLRANLIDLKKYCKENQLKYTSLREMVARKNLERMHGTESSSSHSQPFFTVFRIISKQSRIERDGTTLLFYPDFEVEWNLEIMPDYQQYLDNYRKEHGSYPSEYEEICLAYADFAKKIKEEFPKLPLCRDLFNMLGVITGVSYFYNTLQAMGKAPVLESKPIVHPYHFPEVLPSLPVRYYKFRDLEISLSEVFSEINKNATEKSRTDEEFKSLILNPGEKNLSQDLKTRLAQVIQKIISKKLSLEDVNEDEVDNMLDNINDGMILLLNQFSQVCREQIEKRLNKKIEASSSIINMMREAVAHFESDKRVYVGLIKKWEKEGINKYYFLRAIDPSLKKEAEVELKKIKDELTYGLSRLELKIEERIKKNKKECETANKKIQEQSAGVINERTVRMESAVDHQVEEAIAKIHEQVNNLRGVRILWERVNAQCDAIRAQGLEIKQAERAKIIAEVDENVKSLISKNNLQCQHETSRLHAELKKARENLPADIIRLSMEFAIKNVENYIDSVVADLNKRLASIHSFTTQIVTEKELGNIPVNPSKKYCYSVLSFSDADIPGTASKLIIHGGCDVDMPDVTAERMVNAAEFRKKIAASTKAREEFNVIDVAGRSYAVFGMRAKDYVATHASENNELSVVRTLYTVQESQPINENTLLSALPEEENQDDPVEIMNFAVLSNDEKIIFDLLDTHPEYLEIKGRNGITPLLNAAQQGNTTAVRALIKRGANVNHTLPNELYALYLAIQNGYSDTALALLEVENIQLSDQVNQALTPLHLALQMGLENVAIKLVERKANLTVFSRQDGLTAFHTAVKCSSLPVVRAMLISKPELINSLTESGKTALHIAAEDNNTTMLSLLLEFKANPDVFSNTGVTPLMSAIEAGHAAVARRLARITKVGLKDHYQRTASILAATYGEWDVQAILKKRGENPYILDSFGQNCLYHAVVQGNEEALLEINNSAAQQEYNGHSLLALAAQYGHFNLVEHLKKSVFKTAQKGMTCLLFAVIADEVIYVIKNALSIPDKIQEGVYQGKTWAYLAAVSGSKRCLKYFLSKCSDEDVVSQKILFAAVEGRDHDCIVRVSNRLKDMNNLFDESGETALHRAAHAHSIEMVELLLSQGAKITSENSSKQTIFHIAIEIGDKRLLKRLLKLTKHTPEERPHDLMDVLKKYPNKSLALVLKKYNY
ncbi:MAG: ankyrin repeat domain-containing protein, partial [Gammaproteobacteria bacterium]|nr:ankyrin repeat domain-containing protein [Gammaproteobacteria bacterium]